ncbi:MAG: TIR domain-containing protein [Betaproteobacteria bacterium]|nr:TIR domain-containing protein [Betaproteobacteria bacterium]
MSAPPKAIFLSYASQDAQAARRICDALRAVGLEVWFDQSALRGGDAWDASIRRQIKECALFVPVISATTQLREEGYFRLEWKLAVDRSHLMAEDKTFLLPVVIDAAIDANARVPEKFREVQWTHLAGGEASAAFAERVQRLLSGGAAPGPVAPLLATPPSVTPPRAMPAATSEALASTAVPAHGPPSIAVLPFVNRSQDPEDEYFSDGLADELLNVLAKIRGLRVAARSSAYTFKGKGATVAEVGNALNVATVLEGSVRKAGNRMRISVQLVKVADGYHLWSETYDRTLEDIFAVQDDIAQSVVKELRSTLMGEVADAKAGYEVTAALAVAVKGRSTDSEAHRLFLQARHLIDRFTQEDTTKGIGYLKEALALAPEFALAWAELGRAYSEEANWGWAPAAEGFGRAREALARALALEPDLPEAHAGMGWIQMVLERDWRGAETSFHRALELAPGNAFVLQQASNLAGYMGRFDEAIGLARRSVEQDPLSASAYFFFGATLWTADRPAEAITALRKSLELAPQRGAVRAFIALNLLAQGLGEEAMTEALREPAEWARLFALAIIQYAAGRRTESDEALHELTLKWANDAAYQIAEVHAVHGDADLAFEWLERAYVQRDAGAPWSKVDPFLRALHADPRWNAFLQRMGLAD